MSADLKINVHSLASDNAKCFLFMKASELPIGQLSSLSTKLGKSKICKKKGAKF